MKDSWKEITLDELALFRRGSFPQPYGLDKWYDDVNGMPFIQVFDVGDNMKLKPETKRKISKLAEKMSVFIEKGTLILTIQGSIGRVAITEYDAFMDRTLLVFQKFHEDVDLKFIMYTIKELFEKAKDNANGSTIKTITKEELSEFKINLPPLPQQRKIAEILSTVDAVLEKTEAAIAKYQQLKQGLMHDVFTRGIDTNTGQLRPKQTEAPELYKQSPLGWIPKEWEFCSIGEYSQITKLAGFEYTNYFDYSIGGEIIAVRALNLKKGKLDLTNIHTIPKETSKFLTRSQLKKGDVVISYVGTLGEVAVIPENNKFHLAPNVAKISVEESKINPFFLNEYLASKEGQKEIFRWAASTTQAALSMENLRQVRVIIPKITEQKLIYERLDVINSKITIEEAFFSKYQLLKAGLLQDLLTGKVEVRV